MKAVIILVGLLCLGFVEFSEAATSTMTIRESTTFCQKEVPNYCVSTTCPIFCNSLRTKSQKDLCNSGCTTSKRCKLFDTSDSTNTALAKQNSDQLTACIAEKRDPTGNVTGRRMTRWQDIRTSSFTRAVRP